jgi:hypothetical protein
MRPPKKKTSSSKKNIIQKKTSSFQPLKTLIIIPDWYATLKKIKMKVPQFPGPVWSVVFKSGYQSNTDYA